MKDRSKVIFGNEISKKDYQKAVKQKKSFQKKFGDDSAKSYHFSAVPNATLASLGVQNLVLSDKDMTFPENALFVGNIRMGYGHYRISMAIASAAHALGYVPYWLDLNAYPETCATRIISHQNDLYSLGSRLSQRFSLFNKLVWEPINSEGFRKLSYNAKDQKTSELMAPLLANLPKHIPFVATHAWPAQAAVHAGFEKVVNVIADNWPMALHLAEGSIHTVQTPSTFIGYKMLRGFDAKKQLSPMPDGTVFDVGHYIDVELTDHIEEDNAARLARLQNGAPRRYLLSIGGAGAQQKLFEDIIAHLLPEVKKGKATLLINIGDHKTVWEQMLTRVNGLKEAAQMHWNDYANTCALLEKDDLQGVQVFGDDDIFAAVYLTNLLMRRCDVLLTKPGELSYYPVPKIMIRRVGGHEMWGAIRAAEVGDGTYECEKTEEILAMIDQILYGKEIFTALCRGVEEAMRAGIYRGALRAVELAVKK